MLASSSITFLLEMVQVDTNKRKENGEVMRESSFKNQCKISILDALLRNTSSETNPAEVWLLFHGKKKIANDLCPNLVRGNGGGKHSIKGSKQNTANCGPLVRLLFHCLVPTLSLPSVLSCFNTSSPGRGIGHPILHLSFTCSSPNTWARTSFCFGSQISLSHPASPPKAFHPEE